MSKFVEIALSVQNTFYTLLLATCWADFCDTWLTWSLCSIVAYVQQIFPKWSLICCSDLWPQCLVRYCWADFIDTSCIVYVFALSDYSLFICRYTKYDVQIIRHCFQYTATVLTSTLAFQNERKLKNETQVGIKMNISITLYKCIFTQCFLNLCIKGHGRVDTVLTY